MRTALLSLLVLLLGPGAAAAQGNPTNPADFANNPHPGMPWVGLGHPGRADYGSVVRYIEVPPQRVTVPVYVPGPGSFAGAFQPQEVEVPGYVVTETTTGYLYPERWGLQEVTPGVYEWRVLPQTFRPR